MAGLRARKQENRCTRSVIDCIDLVDLLCGLNPNWLPVKSVIFTSGFLNYQQMKTVSLQ